MTSAARPYYVPVGIEEQVFAAAFRQGMSVVLKGPTGCGKTRFVEAMAHDLDRPLVTVSCHDDLTAADLVGRFLLQDGETRWVDGPLTRAVREGAICYLDEVVEARQDTTVVIHPLADHRRQLPIDRLGVVLDAAPGFCLVVSYNPGYQSVLKDLKDSTRQRMVAIELTFPPPDVEEKIVSHEAGVDHDTAAQLVQLGQAIRRLETAGLREVASTRVLIAAGRLMAEGCPPAAAAGRGRRTAHRRPARRRRPGRDDRRVPGGRLSRGHPTGHGSLSPHRLLRRPGADSRDRQRPRSLAPAVGIAALAVVLAAAPRRGAVADRIRNPDVEGAPRPSSPSGAAPTGSPSTRSGPS